VCIFGGVPNKQRDHKYVSLLLRHGIWESNMIDDDLRKDYDYIKIIICTKKLSHGKSQSKWSTTTPSQHSI